MKFLLRTLLATLAAAVLAVGAHAADAVKIGVIYPLTGNAASAGNSANDAIELGADVPEPALERLRHRIMQERPRSRQAGQLRDPGAHRAGARDADRARGGAHFTPAPAR